MIGQAEALLLYSGSEPAFREQEELLKSWGASRYLGADAGLASLYDLALLSAMYGMFAGFLHSVALVTTETVRARAECDPGRAGEPTAGSAGVESGDAQPLAVAGPRAALLESRTAADKGVGRATSAGRTLGTIAPVIAAVGTAVLIPGLVFAGRLQSH